MCGSGNVRGLGSEVRGFLKEDGLGSKKMGCLFGQVNEGGFMRLGPNQRNQEAGLGPNPKGLTEVVHSREKFRAGT